MKLAMKSFDYSLLRIFILLQAGVVLTTQFIIKLGGVEVYPLMVKSVTNLWVVLLSKIVALTCLILPYYLMKRYKLENKKAYIGMRIVFIFVISVAIYDFGNNCIELIRF